jgi:hypothetical protein
VVGPAGAKPKDGNGDLVFPEENIIHRFEPTITHVTASPSELTVQTTSLSGKTIGSILTIPR